MDLRFLRNWLRTDWLTDWLTDGPNYCITTHYLTVLGNDVTTLLSMEITHSRDFDHHATFLGIALRKAKQRRRSILYGGGIGTKMQLNRVSRHWTINTMSLNLTSSYRITYFMSLDRTSFYWIVRHSIGLYTSCHWIGPHVIGSYVILSDYILHVIGSDVILLDHVVHHFIGSYIPCH